MTPLIQLEQVSHAYGHVPLLDEANVQVASGERVAVVGPNGAGKSTLLRILHGALAPDGGRVHRGATVRTGLLVQDVADASSDSVFDLVAHGLGALGDLARDYHRAALEVAREATPERLESLGHFQQLLEKQDGWRLEQRVEQLIARLGLPPDELVDRLSGGWRRRTLLAQALVAEPDVLLLDEPTNHLDLETIAWLETLVAKYQGAVVLVTHDRRFLKTVATRIVELDRGQVTSWSGDYENYLRRQEERETDEAARWARLDRKQAVEEAWIRRGIKARRTRNEGRVKALQAMRQARATRRQRSGPVRLRATHAGDPGRVVFEVDDLHKAYGETRVIHGFSTHVLRGDRIGLIGPNGAGKTTLLRLLLGAEEPDRGEVRKGHRVEVAYYDQQREQLDPDRTVFETVGEGNDTVTVAGASRHVHGYLEDYLFSRERVRSPVRALSGGERNRLLLARLFTRPANVLVLDEPTNDLDVETLELLEAQLVTWPGTVLLVSHDRAFLDNVVTSTLVFEGEGQVREYVGGYDDWLRQQPAPSGDTDPAEVRPRPASRKMSDGSARLSYNEQRELVALPGQIEALERELDTLNAMVAGPTFYQEAADAIKETMARLESVQEQVGQAYGRWEQLEARRGSFRG
ncbi:MAG: ABC transporter ATP-binding protein [Acidobacteria bacterium]|nr:ABC transporter ATP-binding protein [Acidobacteriota bacterium]